MIPLADIGEGVTHYDHRNVSFHLYRKQVHMLLAYRLNKESKPILLVSKDPSSA